MRSSEAIPCLIATGSIIAENVILLVLSWGDKKNNAVDAFSHLSVRGPNFATGIIVYLSDVFSEIAFGILRTIIYLYFLSVLHLKLDF